MSKKRSNYFVSKIPPSLTFEIRSLGFSTLRSSLAYFIFRRNRRKQFARSGEFAIKRLHPLDYVQNSKSPSMAILISIRVELASHERDRNNSAEPIAVRSNTDI